MVTMRIFCINLKNRTDRWDNLKTIKNIERFEAVDTVNNTFSLSDIDFSFRPCTTEYGIYFHNCKGAFGCYLSHFYIWKKIVSEKIPYSLILEDDVDKQSIELIIDKLIPNANVDIVVLTKKVRFNGGSLIFNGSEGYLINLTGAKKLIEATETINMIEKITYSESHKVLQTIERFNLTPIVDRFKNALYDPTKRYCITAPLDKFLSICCGNMVLEPLRLKYVIDKQIILDSNSEKSDINIGGSGMVYTYRARKIKKLLRQ